MSGEAHDDFAPTETEGFKLGEKKTLAEYNQLDANDESLRRWKESLLGAGAQAAPGGAASSSDPRTVIILSLGLEVEGREDVIIDLTQADALAQLTNKPFKIKEGAVFQMKVKFQVQNELISGLRYIQVVKRKGIRVSKEEEMLGSYAPNTEATPLYEKRFRADEAPSGMLARGHYTAASTFVDDDKKSHLTFDWSFDITKTWE